MWGLERSAGPLGDGCGRACSTRVGNREGWLCLHFGRGGGGTLDGGGRDEISDGRRGKGLDGRRVRGIEKTLRRGRGWEAWCKFLKGKCLER